MTLGEQIIEELGRTGRRGMYFSFEGYNRLRRVDSACELRDFLIGEQFQDPPMTANVAEVLDYLYEATRTITFEDMVILFALMVICRFETGFQELPLYGFVLYLSFRRKPQRLMPKLRWPFTSPEPAIRV